MRHTLRLELLDADGNPVTMETEDGEEEPIVFFDDLVFEVGRPPGLKPGTPLDFPVAVNSGPLPLAPGGATSGGSRSTAAPTRTGGCRSRRGTTTTIE